jgi:hypothetical protein
MMILITLIVFGIIFYIGVKLYQFDNSTFAKQTGYTFIKTMSDKKISNLKKIFDATSGPESKLLLNVKVEGVHQTQVADAILINKAGIFVIDVNHKKGWISGTDKSYEWVEQLYKNKRNMFPNPVNENVRMIYTLLDAHEDLKKEYFEIMLFFTNACSFQQIEIQAPNVEVLKMNELNVWSKSMSANKLTKEQVTSFYELLMPYASH